MPIEFELKYIINLRHDLEDEIKTLAAGFVNIEQSYLLKKGAIRLRKSYNERLLNYDMTFKHRVNGQTVEIETGIEKTDYDMLYEQSRFRLTKTRYYLDEFEIDFFKKNKETYFCLAEVELENKQEPDFIPKIILDNLLLSVNIDDNRFSSRKLSNRFKAEKLLKDLRNINVLI